MTDTDKDLIRSKLAEPFDPEAIGWKALAISKDNRRCLTVPYLNARDVAERLDSVVGIDGWSDRCIPLPDGSAICELTLRIGAERVTRCDAGSSDMKDATERMKAACSDALKRAAVKFGVGRYLYSLEKTWVDYDQESKQPCEIPELPDWALPVGYMKNGAPGKKPAEDPAKLIDRVQRDLAGAKSIDELRAIWLDVSTAHKAGRITDLQYKEAGTQKDIRKGELEEGIPF